MPAFNQNQWNAFQNATPNPAWVGTPNQFVSQPGYQMTRDGRSPIGTSTDAYGRILFGGEKGSGAGSGGGSGSGSGGGSMVDPADQPGGWRYEQKRQDDLTDYRTKSGINTGASQADTLYGGRVGAASSAPSAASLGQAKGLYDFSNGMYGGFAANGGYSPQDMAQMDALGQQDITNTIAGQQSGLSQSLASRGLGGNPALAAALGASGINAGIGQRAHARMDLRQAQIGNQFQGLSGLSNNNAALSKLYTTPSYEDVNSRLNTIGSDPNSGGLYSNVTASSTTPEASNPYVKNGRFDMSEWLRKNRG